MRRTAATLGVAALILAAPNGSWTMAEAQNRVLSVQNMDFGRLVVLGTGEAIMDPTRLGFMETRGDLLAIGDGTVGAIRFRCTAEVDYEYRIAPLTVPDSVADLDLLVMEAARPDRALQGGVGVGECPRDGIAELRVGGRLSFGEAADDAGDQTVTLDIEIDLDYGRWMDGDG